MAGERAQLSDYRSHLRRGARSIGILRMADDADHAVLSERTGRPIPLAQRVEPGVGVVMADMGRIDQCDQQVDIKQERHRRSSRNALTTSRVTTACGSLIGNSAIPLREAAAAGRRRALRTRSDTTSPTLR